MWPMRRVQAILVIVAFLAAPIALLARGVFCDPAECDCMTICAHLVSQGKPMCGMAKHAAAPMCGTHQGHHALDYGFIAPFAPAIPLPHAALSVPLVSREFAPQFAQVSVDGIHSVPFEPPRS
jgi:hypothetical protein